VFSNKTDRHDITEILLKVALNTINKPTNKSFILSSIGIGMMLAVLSVLVAGILEIYRKKDISVNQTLLGDHFNASSISVFAQIPQFTLFGASEVFTSISGNLIS
jgi:dipeptide/tripeptide permease